MLKIAAVALMTAVPAPIVTGVHSPTQTAPIQSMPMLSILGVRYEAVAVDIYPGADKLRESRGLRGRRRLGPQWCPWVQFALPSVYVHLAQRTLARRRMDTTGV